MAVLPPKPSERMSLTAILWVIGTLFGLLLLLFVIALVFQAVANQWSDRRRSSRNESGGDGGSGWGTGGWDGHGFPGGGPPLPSLPMPHKETEKDKGGDKKGQESVPAPMPTIHAPMGYYQILTPGPWEGR